jgi:hypothetical protein
VWIPPCRDKLPIPTVIVVPQLVPLSRTCPLRCVAQSSRWGVVSRQPTGGGLARRSHVSRLSQPGELAQYRRASAVKQTCEYVINEVCADGHHLFVVLSIPPLYASVRAGDGRKNTLWPRSQRQGAGFLPRLVPVENGGNLCVEVGTCADDEQEHDEQ